MVDLMVLECQIAQDIFLYHIMRVGGLEVVTKPMESLLNAHVPIIMVCGEHGRK